MALSAFDLFSIGIGPSSSHTVGPMRAAKRFVDDLAASGILGRTDRVKVELFGSLGATGRGHGSEQAIILGLEGEEPATVDTARAEGRVELIKATETLVLGGVHPVRLKPSDDITLHRNRSLPGHPNAMTFAAFDRRGVELRQRRYYSVGGGFVVDEDAAGVDRIVDATELKYPFSSGADLLRICREQGASISDVMLANETAWGTEDEIRNGLLNIWAVMKSCVQTGLRRDGVLPGGLQVPRRAPALHAELMSRTDRSDPLHIMDWVNLYALAVNEENASGGRVVTAPTNGAAGIMPAVLHYYWHFGPDGANEEGIIRFMLAAAAIGIIVKKNASISGAEVGCQGEVGTACAMAAAGLAEVMGGTPEQVENAAEIGIEHNLGLTCDPIGGLVQIPCIERNAVASVKAINAARLALKGTGRHKVTLDQAIKTMRETGHDMHIKYKETSRGGLAVNVIEC
ncbi:L-serine ammonia-lyase [Nocardioides sp. LMS-CY]|uniref:L-serine ammonia-lyase n=1 Tax=Nocardioides sp. (strain LMS-CY) TaxID=2840457 RepID=UPI001C003D5A|nr:L-serine ammonia-lyase [Nocardioides sp. LMS-CY]QWF24542.1 L-serine ammonia-lyase [Nocardioides sp. LMS-CY]